jgi:peroxiredoxin
MAGTLSTMIPLGMKAPDFSLLDTCSNKIKTLDGLKSDMATVIMFICNHCPYVKYIQTMLVEIANFYQSKGISFIAISSNDVSAYPQDGAGYMRQEAEKHQYPFPYLFDETQAIARAYQATCTPDFYIFDKNLKCLYRGRFDDSTPGNGKPTTGADLREALDNILCNQPVNTNQHPSLGCNIKWKK